MKRLGENLKLWMDQLDEKYFTTEWMYFGGIYLTLLSLVPQRSVFLAYQKLVSLFSYCSTRYCRGSENILHCERKHKWQ